MTSRRAIALAAALSIALGACAGSETDPAVARQERVQARLADTFTSTQAECIVDALDPTALLALDETTDLGADSPALSTYTKAVVDCTAAS